jgi:hypothetical protein
VLLSVSCIVVLCVCGLALRFRSVPCQRTRQCREFARRNEWFHVYVTRRLWALTSHSTPSSTSSITIITINNNITLRCLFVIDLLFCYWAFGVCYCLRNNMSDTTSTIEYDENEVMPGVFLMQPRTSSSSSSSPSTQANAVFSAPLVERQLELARLQHSIHHLHRSNMEMAQFCEQHQDLDADLVTSIVENEQVIKRQRTTISLLHHSIHRDFGIALPSDLEQHDDAQRIEQVRQVLVSVSKRDSSASSQSTRTATANTTTSASTSPSPSSPSSVSIYLWDTLVVAK